MKLGSLLGGIAQGAATAFAMKRAMGKKAPAGGALPSAGGKFAGEDLPDTLEHPPDEWSGYAQGGYVQPKSYADGGYVMGGSYEEHSTKSYEHCTGHRDMGK
jgi:hypothetical protein